MQQNTSASGTLDENIALSKIKEQTSTSEQKATRDHGRPVEGATGTCAAEVAIDVVAKLVDAVGIS